jgi:hypothetical protein
MMTQEEQEAFGFVNREFSPCFLQGTDDDQRKEEAARGSYLEPRHHCLPTNVSNREAESHRAVQ